MSLSIWLVVVERRWRRKRIGLWMNVGDEYWWLWKLSDEDGGGLWRFRLVRVDDGGC
jgi:hypothetical protein